MLSTKLRLDLCIILYKMRLNKEVTLEERIWVQKLVDHNRHARTLHDLILHTGEYAP